MLPRVVCLARELLLFRRVREFYTENSTQETELGDQARCRVRPLLCPWGQQGVLWVRRDTHQVAILWQAASSIGRPCSWNRGPRSAVMAAKRAGYEWWVRITSERCRGIRPLNEK